MLKFKKISFKDIISNPIFSSSILAIIYVYFILGVFTFKTHPTPFIDSCIIFEILLFSIFSLFYFLMSKVSMDKKFISAISLRFTFLISVAFLTQTLLSEILHPYRGIISPLIEQIVGYIFVTFLYMIPVFIISFSTLFLTNKLYQLLKKN